MKSEKKIIALSTDIEITIFGKQAERLVRSGSFNVLYP